MVRKVFILLLLIAHAANDGLVHSKPPAGKTVRRRPASSGHSDVWLRILALEEQRQIGDGYLVHLLAYPDLTIRASAILALGRIGKSAVIPELSVLLNRRKGPLKKETVFSLGLIPDETASTVLVQHLAMQNDPALIASIYRAIGNSGSEKIVSLLAEAIQKPSQSGDVLSGACYSLGQLWSKDRTDAGASVPTGLLDRLVEIVATASSSSSDCAFALSRFKGKAVFKNTGQLVQASNHRDPEVRRLIVRLLGKLPTETSLFPLLALAGTGQPTSVRIEAIKAISAVGYADLAETSIRQALESGSNALKLQTIDVTATLGVNGQKFISQLQKIYAESTSTWLKSHALLALSAIAPEKARPTVTEALASPNPFLQAAAARAMTANPNEVELLELARVLTEGKTRATLEVIEGLSAHPEDSLGPAIRPALLKAVEGGDPGVLALASQWVARLSWKEFAGPLARGYSRLANYDLVDTRVNLLRALATLADPTTTPTLKIAARDPNPMVALAATEALQSLALSQGALDTSRNIQSTSLGFSLSEVLRAQESTVVLRTDRGEIHVRLFAETPLTSLHFLRLVQKKFYDGLIFHRVIPGFVAQGGDPRGDGYGGCGYLIPDEIAAVSHGTGIVGISSSGRDTGGSQFFINLGPNYHLDYRYTAFGKIVKGLSVAEKLEEGDRILAAYLLQKSGPSQPN